MKTLALALLLTTTLTNAEPVTVRGIDYDISTVKGTYLEHRALLEKQPWFGHRQLAKHFVIEHMGYSPTIPVGSVEKAVNTGGNDSAYFVYFDHAAEATAVVAVNTSGELCILDGLNDYSRVPQSCNINLARAIKATGSRCTGYDVCHWAVATKIERFNVLPPSGTYYQEDNFNLVITGVVAPVDHITTIYNGYNISYLLNSCWKKVGTTVRCDNIAWSAFNQGQHTLEFYLDLNNGEQHYKANVYSVQ